MTRILKSFFLAAAMIAIIPVSAAAATYQVGGCKPKLTNFAMISAAVSSVPAGSTIDVCPGIYPEQVTITKPLSLQGVSSTTASRAIIVINANGQLAPNVTSITGVNVYAQVLVQNVTPAGAVNITGITIDGTGAINGCPSANGLAGIFYAKGTTGIVNEVTARNQVGGCGFGNGIWIENSAGAGQSVTIENNSVHNMDGNAIVTISDQNPTTLTAAIKQNFVTSPTSGSVATGVYAEGSGGTVSDNVITGGNFGIFNAGPITGPDCCAVTISGNVMADMPGTVAAGIGWLVTGSVAQSNKISNVYLGFWPAHGTVKSNTTLNTKYIADFYCMSNGAVRGNVFNDSQYGFYEAPVPVTGNANYNIDTLTAGACP